MGFSVPQIPWELMHTMYQLKSGGKYSQQDGGQWVPSKDEQVAFQGVVLPVSDKDLQRTPTGTYSKDSEKFIPMAMPWKWVGVFTIRKVI